MYIRHAVVVVEELKCINYSGGICFIDDDSISSVVVRGWVNVPPFSTMG